MYQNKAQISGPGRTGRRGPVRRRRDSDAGGELLREAEQRTRILGPLSECFTDYRDSGVEHPVEALIKQRVLGLCLGYEDLELCRDRLLALCDRDDLTGESGAWSRIEANRWQARAEWKMASCC